MGLVWSCWMLTVSNHCWMTDVDGCWRMLVWPRVQVQFPASHLGGGHLVESGDPLLDLSQ